MNDKKIVVIDYGMGNLGSVQNMLKHLGFSCVLSGKKEDILNADFLILPGVGKFDQAMINIKSFNLEDAIKNRVLDDAIPTLGICLGMQIMCKKSEEGLESGLHLVDYEVKKFSKENNRLRIPHIGWNYIKFQENNKLFTRLPKESRFYFVHSYYVQDSESSLKICTTEYGINFVSGFAKGNLFGVQFHPEKSHKFGKQLFLNFLNFYG